MITISVYVLGRGGYGGGRGGPRRNQGWVDYEYNHEMDRRPPGGDRPMNKVSDGSWITFNLMTSREQGCQ